MVEVKAGVSFYANDAEVKNPYTFNEIGEFNVVAKKSGYKDSNVWTIKVIEERVSRDNKKLIIETVGGITSVRSQEKPTIHVDRVQKTVKTLRSLSR